ncbi:MAG: helix-turn-helix domain-containing protein [Ruminococcaceae bacterium]|nr:helix-turn-helix domain-containing protein [Oscillospiraceae bacterium]
MINEFPRIITLLRKERGLSQKAVAQELKVSQALLSHYEKGIRECGLDFLVKAAIFYNVSTDYLLGRTPDRHGAVIDVQDLPDENAMGKENVFKGSMLPVLNKRLIINSMNVLFDLLSTAKSKDLTMEASNQIMIAVYKSFRSIYELNKTNPDSLFAAEKDCYRELANAALIKSDVRLKALTRESKSVKVKPVRVNEEDFALNQSQIEEKYPSFAASLFNLIQNAEIAMQAKTKK